MNFSRWLNMVGLVLGACGAFLMAWYPPRVHPYNEDGSAAFAFTSNPTPEGRIRGKRQAILGKTGPLLLGVGFLLQLAAV